MDECGSGKAGVAERVGDDLESGHISLSSTADGDSGTAYTGPRQISTSGERRPGESLEEW